MDLWTLDVWAKPSRYECKREHINTTIELLARIEESMEPTTRQMNGFRIPPPIACRTTIAGCIGQPWWSVLPSAKEGY